MVAVTLGEGGMGQWPMCPPLNCTQLTNLGKYSKKIWNFSMAFASKRRASPQWLSSGKKLILAFFPQIFCSTISVEHSPIGLSKDLFQTNFHPFLPHFSSFALESYLYETDFTPGPSQNYHSSVFL